MLMYADINKYIYIYVYIHIVSVHMAKYGYINSHSRYSNDYENPNLGEYSFSPGLEFAHEG